MKTAEKIAVLNRCSVFAGVPRTELALLAEMLNTESLHAGEVLFAAGELSDRVFVIARGNVSIFLQKDLLPVRSLGPGELLGEYGMFSNLVRTATVKATTETVLLSLDYTRFRSFLLRYPEATLVLLQTAVERLTRAEQNGSKKTPTV